MVMPGTWFDVYRAFLLRFAFPPSKGGDRGDVHIHAIAGKHYTANNSTPKHLNNSTNQQINISITQHPKSIQGLKARIISAPSRKGGGSTSGPCSEG